MPRKPQVRYFDSRHAFYCQLNGRQHKLADAPAGDDSPSGPCYLAALEAFKQLLTLGNVLSAKDSNTVRAVLESYLQHIKPKASATTFTRRLKAFVPFCAVHGETAVSTLTPHAIDDFLTGMRKPRRLNEATKQMAKWGDGAVRVFLDCAVTAFKWAIKRKLVTFNPFLDVDRPRRKSRSRKCLVKPEQHQLILQTCEGNWRTRPLCQLIIALEATGARPGELAAATAAEWNEELQAIAYVGDDRRRQDEFRHKTARLDKDRVIFFTGAALRTIRELIALHPTGQLFRNRRGLPWTGTAICCAFMGLRDKVGMPDLIAYSYRHTLATNWLKAGRSVDVLAELLGNSPETIRRHYAHLMADRMAMRRQLEDFRKGEGTGTPTAERT